MSPQKDLLVNTTTTNKDTKPISSSLRERCRNTLRVCTNLTKRVRSSARVVKLVRNPSRGPEENESSSSGSTLSFEEFENPRPAPPVGGTNRAKVTHRRTMSSVLTPGTATPTSKLQQGLMSTRKRMSLDSKLTTARPISMFSRRPLSFLGILPPEDQDQEEEEEETLPKPTVFLQHPSPPLDPPQMLPRGQWGDPQSDPWGTSASDIPHYPYPYHPAPVPPSTPPVLTGFSAILTAAQHYRADDPNIVHHVQALAPGLSVGFSGNALTSALYNPFDIMPIGSRPRWAGYSHIVRLVRAREERGAGDRKGKRRTVDMGRRMEDGAQEKREAGMVWVRSYESDDGRGVQVLTLVVPRDEQGSTVLQTTLDVNQLIVARDFLALALPSATPSTSSAQQGKGGLVHILIVAPLLEPASSPAPVPQTRRQSAMAEVMEPHVESELEIGMEQNIASRLETVDPFVKGGPSHNSSSFSRPASIRFSSASLSPNSTVFPDSPPGQLKYTTIVHFPDQQNPRVHEQQTRNVLSIFAIYRAFAFAAQPIPSAWAALSARLRDHLIYALEVKETALRNGWCDSNGVRRGFSSADEIMNERRVQAARVWMGLGEADSWDGLDGEGLLEGWEALRLAAEYEV